MDPLSAPFPPSSNSHARIHIHPRTYFASAHTALARSSTNTLDSRETNIEHTRNEMAEAMEIPGMAWMVRKEEALIQFKEPYGTVVPSTQPKADTTTQTPPIRG